MVTERPCYVCREYVTDGVRVLVLPGKCVCPYPHYEPPYRVPWWRTSIDTTKMRTPLDV